MEYYEVISVSLTSHKEFVLTIEADEAETTETITLTARVDGETVSANNYGYFQAFQELRDMLLHRRYGLKCAGSMLNAVQSGMASASDKVCMVKLGQQGRRECVVSLYDNMEISEFPNTEEQNAFLKKWIDSLGQQSIT